MSLPPLEQESATDRWPDLNRKLKLIIERLEEMRERFKDKTVFQAGVRAGLSQAIEVVKEMVRREGGTA